MLLGYPDAAEMDSLPSNSKHATSFSIVPCSIFLVEQCAVYTSSIYHILPINQLNSKELLDHLKYILKDQFVLWISVKENSSFNIEFIDMHDANFAYAMIQCSLWSRKYCAFAACSCLRVEGKLADHACILFMLQEYNDLQQKSEEHMHSQDTLTAVHRTGEYTDSHHCD